MCGPDCIFVGMKQHETMHYLERPGSPLDYILEALHACA